MSVTRTRYLILFGILGGLIAGLVLAGWLHLAILQPHPCGDPIQAEISSSMASNGRYGAIYGVSARARDGRVYQVMLPTANVSVGDRLNLQRICRADGHVLNIARVIPDSLRRVRDRAGE